MMNEKIGLGITTYNSEDYFSELYNSLPLDKIDECIVVNGGDAYCGHYEGCDWLQHRTNRRPSVCRNDCLRFLKSKGVEHFFIIEDDMVIKNPNVFDEYIAHSKESKIEYLCFVSTGDGSGTPDERTPRLIVNFNNNKSICMYRNMANEFTYRSARMLEACGYYDENYKHMFDVDNVYKISKTEMSTPFWWFPDILNSDDYIMNNPEAVSRLQAGGKRNDDLPPEFERFEKIHGVPVPMIPNASSDEVVRFLKTLRE